MTIPSMDMQTVKQDPMLKWIVGGVLLLIAVGYFVFLYALYSRVTETDGYIQEFIEAQVNRATVVGDVLRDTPSDTDRTDNRD